MAAPVLLAATIGIGLTIASSPSSLTGRHAYVASAPRTQSPADSPSPIPSSTSRGKLGDGAHLWLSPSGLLIGSAPNLIVESGDGGLTWTILQSPANASGIAVDIGNSAVVVAGGATIQVSADGGSSWQPTRTNPPGAGPYQPLELSPFDAGVWFLTHQQRLLLTRNASTTWRDLPNLPPLTAPVMVPSGVFGSFYLATGGRVFELIDNGQQISELPGLPQGVTATDLAVVGGNPASLLARGGTDSAYLLKGQEWSSAGGGLHGPVAVGPNGLLLVGDGAGKLGSPGAVAYSIDAGTTWSHATGLPVDQSVESIAGQPSSTRLFAYCYGGDIYTSTDGGGTWSVLSKALRANTT